MTYEEVLRDARGEARRLGARIRELRQEEDISRRTLARRARVRPQMIDKLERGQSTFPSLYVVRRVADALQLSIDDLIGRTPPAKVRRRKMEGR